MTLLERTCELKRLADALLIAIQCVENERGAGSDTLGNAAGQVDDACQTLAAAVAEEDEAAAFQDALAAGEPWAVIEHREQIAHERNDYNRKVA